MSHENAEIELKELTCRVEVSHWTATFLRSQPIGYGTSSEGGEGLTKTGIADLSMFVFLKLHLIFMKWWVKFDDIAV